MIVRFEVVYNKGDGQPHRTEHLRTKHLFDETVRLCKLLGYEVISTKQVLDPEPLPKKYTKLGYRFKPLAV